MNELPQAAVAFFAAAVTECRASRRERRMRALWLSAEFDCGPEASEGKTAMLKTAYELARADSLDALRALSKAHETWRRMGGTRSDTETDTWLRQVMAEAEKPQ